MMPMERSAVQLDADEYIFVGFSRIEWAHYGTHIFACIVEPDSFSSGY
jgi:hypothetical protein